MSQEVIENLLGSIPTGEIIKDPREGDHADATIRAVELIDHGSGRALKITYGNLTDANGREFEHQERLTIPNSSSHEAVQRIFLSACHNLEIVPRSMRKTILADTPQDQETIHQAFASKVDTSLNIRLRPDKDGYLKAAFLRRK